MAPENNSAEPEYYANIDSHRDFWTKEFFNRRFGAFFTDYLYILDYGQLDLNKNSKNPNDKIQPSRSEEKLTWADCDVQEVLNWPKLCEVSYKKFYVGPGVVNLNSLTVGTLFMVKLWAETRNISSQSETRLCDFQIGR